MNFGGSIKNKVTNPDLLDERAKCIFNQREMEEFLFSKEVAEYSDDVLVDQKKHPELCNDFSWYDMTREEKQANWLRRYNILSNMDREKYITNAKKPNGFYWAYYYQGFSPLHLHSTMFTKTVANLASEK